MSFAVEKAKPNSKRFILMKITPGRYISADMVSVGGGVYDYTWPGFLIEKVERNGVVMTPVETTPTTNDTWYWSGSPDTAIEIKLAAAPSSTNVIVVFYSLFYTSGEYRSFRLDPDDINSPEVVWEPRLEKEPNVKHSVRDTISGTISTVISTIAIANTDDAFQKYLTVNDSFSKKQIRTWVSINGQIQRVYGGFVERLDIDHKQVNITAFDMFSLLDKPALMGDKDSEAHWYRRTGSFPNTLPESNGEPIRFILGKHSPYETVSYASMLWGSQQIDTGSLLSAVLTSYSITGTTTAVNRVWGLCRTLTNGLSGPGNFSGTVSSLSSSGNLTIFQITLAQFATLNAIMGDHFKMVSNSITRYGRLIKIDIGSNVTLSFETTSITTPGFNTSFVLTGQKVSVIFVQGGKDVPLFEENDYTLNQTVLASGNIYHHIALKNNFEGSHVFPGTSTYLSPLDPGSDKMYFRVRTNTTNMGHAQVLKRMVEDAGLATGSASYTVAQSALNVNTHFTIPQIDETLIEGYRKYAEEICKSTMGALYTNESFELEYQLLSTPSSANVTDNKDYSDLTIDVEYQDIVTELVTSNPHNASDAATQATPSPNVTVSNVVAEHLHGVKKTLQYIHVLETMTDRAQDILDILSNRRAIYSFTTPTKFVDAIMCTDMKLESGRLLGGVSSIDLKIISSDKSATDTIIEATDLYNI